jgi:hypothetical protein
MGLAGGAVVLSSMFQVAPASAYALMNCHMSSPHSSYGTTGGVTGQYATAIVNAANDWSQTATPLIIYAGSSSSQFSVDAFNFGNTGQDGVQTSSGCHSGIWVYPYANWNTYYTNAYSVTGKEQVMVHEIGHVLGLAHYGINTCTGQPIMYGSSSRYFTCGHVKPQLDDVNGINYIYP